MKKLVSVMVMLLVVACGSAVYEELFNIPDAQGGTPNEIKGVWKITSGLGRGIEVRMRVKQNEVTLAQRCTYNGESVIVGKTVPAKVSNDEIELLEDIAEREVFQGNAVCYLRFAKQTFRVYPTERVASMTGPAGGMFLSKLAD